MTTLRRFLTGAALMVVASGLASANSIIVNCTPAINAPGHPTELNQLESCGGLAGTGVLASWITGISFEVLGSVDNPPSTISLTNNDTNGAHSGYAFTDSAFNLSGVTAGVTLPTDGFGNLFDVLAGTCSPLTSSCVNLNAGQSATINVSGNANSGLINVTSNFAGWEAATTFTVNTTTALTVQFGGGNVGATQVTSDDLSAFVMYNYTIPSGTPEPTTMALMGGALLGLGLLGKRFKKS